LDQKTKARFHDGAVGLEAGRGFGRLEQIAIDSDLFLHAQAG
jgi:hypothetical protein